MSETPLPDVPLIPPVQEVIPYGEFSGFDFGFRTEAGVCWFMRDNGDGSWTVGCDQPHALKDAILDANHEMAAHNSGWSPDKSLRRAASIPQELIGFWHAEGFNIHDQNNTQKLLSRLDSREYHKLRTAEWKIT